MVPGQPPNLLRRLQYLYCGRGAQGPAQPGPVSLITAGEELGVTVGRPPREVVILVAGDTGSGKSAFVNAIVEEIVLPVGRPHPAVQWVCSQELPPGVSPCLFTEAKNEFSGWPAGSHVAPASCIVRCSSPRLGNVEVVEVKMDADADALEWVGARADIVVCLLDSQKQPQASEKLLQWIGKVQRTPGEPSSDGQARPNIQFVLSKADLVQRESDRIRLVAKASKLLTERLGRGFEILPVATGDLEALLDGLSEGTSDCFTLGDRKFEIPRSFVKAGDSQGGSNARKRFDEGTKRTIQAAQQTVEQRKADGLARLRADCEALAASLDMQLAEARARAQSETGSIPLRPKLFQLGGAMLIVGVVVPFFLDSDLDPWIAQICRYIALAMGTVLLILAALIAPSGMDDGKQSSRTGPASRCVSVLEERGRFLRLARRQHAQWAGEDDPTKADDSTLVEEHADRAPGSVLTCRTGDSTAGSTDKELHPFL